MVIIYLNVVIIYFDYIFIDEQGYKIRSIYNLEFDNLVDCFLLVYECIFIDNEDNFLFYGYVCLYCVDCFCEIGGYVIDIFYVDDYDLVF